MGSYYVTNRQGNKLDSALLKKAAELQAGQGDGRISKADAVELAKKVNDGGVRTEVEDRTVRKIYREANFTGPGKDTFEHLNRVAGGKRAWKNRKPAQQAQASQIAALIQQQS